MSSVEKICDRLGIRMQTGLNKKGVLRGMWDFLTSIRDSCELWSMQWFDAVYRLESIRVVARMIGSFQHKVLDAGMKDEKTA